MIVSSNRILAKTLCMIAGMCLAPLATQAQAIWLPGSDPVNIARSGVGVAFGRSLEAGSLNPALLVTLQSPRSAYLSTGMEMQATPHTMSSNERVLYTDDRNRFLPAFGAGWRITPKVAFGVKVDMPFLRHSETPMESSSRFFGQAIDLSSIRAEFQAAYAINEAVSIGISAGITRLDYASALSLRALVPSMADLPASDSNPAEALLETTVRQEGGVSAFSFGVGFRYAVSSRWTVGGSFHSGIKGRPDLSASFAPRGLDIYDTIRDDIPPPIGIEEQARAVLNAMTVQPGAGDLALPYRIQVGVRHRFNQLMTWEVDLRYIGSSSMKMPTQPWINTPSGPVSTLPRPYEFKSGLAVSGMMEINLTRDWIVRSGISLEPELNKGGEVDAVLGGAKSAAFSIGVGHQIFGGELNAGYQYRQAIDSEINGLEGKWNVTGLRATGTLTRVEGMGHILSIGFKRSF